MKYNIKSLIKNLEKLTKIRRSRYHPLVHKICEEHKISRGTLFYIKEYGPHSNVPKTIIREGFRVLLFASIISSFGGLALEYIKQIFISIIPLIILLPALNSMIGGYGTIVSSRFSTMLYKGRGESLTSELRKLFAQVLIIALIMSIGSALLALAISKAFGYSLSYLISLKIFFIALIDVIILVFVLFFFSLGIGKYIYKKGEDPNNFLIPMTTSLADFGNMIVLSLLIILFF